MTGMGILEQPICLRGKPPKTIWLTGLSGAGKTTIALSLQEVLTTLGHASYVLDGDALRQGLNNDLGFSQSDRSENVRRTAHVARLMNDAGITAIVALISPFQVDRQKAKTIIGRDSFKEVYVKTPQELCERRDTKNLYRKARLGLVDQFTGISSPYEPPNDAALEIDLGQDSLPDTIIRLLALWR